MEDGVFGLTRAAAAVDDDEEDEDEEEEEDDEGDEEDEDRMTLGNAADDELEAMYGEAPLKACCICAANCCCKWLFW